MRRVIIVVCIAAVVLIVASILIVSQLFVKPTPGPDPGGMIMRQLESAASLLPGYGTPLLPWRSRPTAQGLYLIKTAPHRTSCYGQIFGWSDVIVQGRFTWSSSAQMLLSEVGSGLAVLGWKSAAGLPGVWKKRIARGIIATAALQLLTGSEWTFLAEAPPAHDALRC